VLNSCIDLCLCVQDPLFVLNKTVQSFWIHRGYIWSSSFQVASRIFSLIFKVPQNVLKRPKHVVRTAWLYQVRKYSSKRSQELKKHFRVQKRSILPSEDLLVPFLPLSMSLQGNQKRGTDHQIQIQKQIRYFWHSFRTLIETIHIIDIFATFIVAYRGKRALPSGHLMVSRSNVIRKQISIKFSISTSTLLLRVALKQW
jgi:hypothetical protein